MSIITYHQDVLALNEESITETLTYIKKEEILKGLFKGSIGFLIAPPDSGKSFLSLSIAYEMALPEYPLIGVRTNNEKIFKTLLWPMEDSLQGTLPRIQAHLSELSVKIKDRLSQYVALYQHWDPICCSRALRNTKEADNCLHALQKLIIAAKDYDLLIIDTLRDAVGSADIVEDDYLIRTALEKLAQDANVAILVVHHPTKDVSRGKDMINSVSGSGLSSTLSKSKLHLYLNQVLNKKNNSNETYLRHIKANYVPYEQQWRTPIPLYWTQNSLLHADPNIIFQLNADDIFIQKESTQKVRKRRLIRLSQEAGLIERDDSLLSEESKRLAQQTTHSPFGGGMASELSELRTFKSTK